MSSFSFVATRLCPAVGLMAHRSFNEVGAPKLLCCLGGSLVTEILSLIGVEEERIKRNPPSSGGRVAPM